MKGDGWEGHIGVGTVLVRTCAVGAAWDAGGYGRRGSSGTGEVSRLALANEESGTSFYGTGEGTEEARRKPVRCRQYSI
jgi:hypothetical protein